MTPADIAWFKAAYGEAMAAAVAGTPFEVDHLVTIACQETGYIWSQLRRKVGLTPAKISALCVGDTLDASAGRRAFPQTADDLIARPNGLQMFDIARKAILDLADNISGFNFVRTNKKKFAHGFGIWQYDIQFFETDPSYFLEKRYENPEQAAKKAVAELLESVRKLRLTGKQKLSDDEFIKCAIVYNSGRYNPDKGLKQGHKNDEGKFYGECIAEFLALSRSVSTPKPVAEQTKKPDPAPVPTDAQDKKTLAGIGAAVVVGSGTVMTTVDHAFPWGAVLVAVALIAAAGLAGFLYLKNKGLLK